jgi:hypothetical protein
MGSNAGLLRCVASCAASQSELAVRGASSLSKLRNGGEVGFARRGLAPDKPDLPLGLGRGKTQEGMSLR